MGGTRVMSALLLVTVILLSASTATANELDIDISPSTVGPGEGLTVLSTCVRGDVTSEAFESMAMVPMDSDTDFLSGASPTVNRDARSGVYEVEVICHNGRSATGELVVTDSGAHTGDGAMAGGMDGTLTGAGALLLLAAGLGAFLVRWRRRGTV